MDDSFAHDGNDCGPSVIAKQVSQIYIYKFFTCKELLLSEMTRCVTELERKFGFSSMSKS